MGSPSLRLGTASPGKTGSSRCERCWHSKAGRPISLFSLSTLLFAASISVSPASDLYVATNGTAGGAGTLSDPWNLATALTNPASVRPGDTIWLRGGTYTGPFVSKLAGTNGVLITLRQYPGERATLDGVSSQTLEVDGAWSAFRDFEVTQSCPNRTNAPLSSGVFVLGANTKFINLIIHDNGGNGIVAGLNATNAEISGCLIYNNGYQAADGVDRGHGHGIYLQGSNPLYKFIYGNVSFNNFAISAKAYAEGPNIDGFKFVGNTFFGAGSLATNWGSGTNGMTYSLQVGGLSMTHNVVAVSNYTYHAGLPNINVDDFWFLYATETNGDLWVSNNYVAGGSAAFMYWSNGIVTGNTFILGGNMQVKNGLSGDEPYVMDRNTYYFPMARATPFYLWATNKWNFTAWKTNTLYDHTGISTDAMPTGTKVFITKDRYDPHRATITVYNWGLSNAVDIVLSNVLELNASFEVRNVQDFFGTPVLTNRYDGSPLHLPMTGLTVARPIGLNASPPPTGPQFNVFVVRQSPDAKASLPPPENLHVLSQGGQ